MMALKRASTDFGLPLRRVHAIIAKKRAAATTPSSAMKDALSGISPAAGAAEPDAAGSVSMGCATERAATIQPRIDAAEPLDRMGLTTIHRWSERTGKSDTCGEPSSVEGMPAVIEARKRIMAGSGVRSRRRPPPIVALRRTACEAETTNKPSTTSPARLSTADRSSGPAAVSCNSCLSCSDCANSRERSLSCSGCLAISRASWLNLICKFSRSDAAARFCKCRRLSVARVSIASAAGKQTASHNDFRASRP